MRSRSERVAEAGARTKLLKVLFMGSEGARSLLIGALPGRGRRWLCLCTWSSERHQQGLHLRQWLLPWCPAAARRWSSACWSRLCGAPRSWQGASNSDGIGVDQGVEPEESVYVTLHVTHVDCFPSSVFVADYAQLELLAGVDASIVCWDGCCVCVHHGVLCVLFVLVVRLLLYHWIFLW